MAMCGPPTESTPEPEGMVVSSRESGAEGLRLGRVSIGPLPTPSAGPFSWPNFSLKAPDGCPSPLPSPWSFDSAVLDSAAEAYGFWTVATIFGSARCLAALAGPGSSPSTDFDEPQHKKPNIRGMPFFRLGRGDVGELVAVVPSSGCCCCCCFSVMILPTGLFERLLLDVLPVLRLSVRVFLEAMLSAEPLIVSPLKPVDAE